MKECKRSRFARVAGIAALLALAVFLLARPTYPTPLYTVDRYEALARRIAPYSSFRVPDANVLPDSVGKYAILLRTRYTTRPNGYWIQFGTENANETRLIVECRLLADLSEDARSIAPNDTLCGIPVETGSTFVKFHLDGCCYDIYGAADQADVFRGIAENLICQK